MISWLIDLILSLLGIILFIVVLGGVYRSLGIAGLVGRLGRKKAKTGFARPRKTR